MQPPNEKIDQIFKNRIGDLEMNPPSEAWEHIRSEVHGKNPGAITKPGFLNFKNYIAGLSVLVLLIISTVFFVLRERKPVAPGETSAVPGPKSTASNDHSLLVLSNAPSEEKASKQNNEIIPDSKQQVNKEISNTSIPDAIVHNSGNTPKKAEGTVISNPDNISINKPLPYSGKASETPSHDKIFNEVQNSQKRNVKVRFPEIGEVMVLADAGTNKPLTKNEVPVGNVSENSEKGTGNIVMQASPPANDYGIRDKWAIGINFTQDYILYPKIPERKNNDYTVGSSIYRQWGDFQIQTGLGFSVMNDLGSYKVDYSKWDVEGTYQHVDSLSFDTSNNTVQPVFWTSTVEVYDSVKVNDKKNTTNRYAYLQVPLLAGYKLFEYKRITGWLNGGPVLAILIYKHEPEIGVDDKNVFRLNITDESPIRLKTNIQLWGSFELGYAITSRFRFTLEPLIKYYASPVYDKNASHPKNPYSTGLRMGLKWNF